MREIITLQCTECKRKNYSKTKNKKTKTERMELKKFCAFCRKHQRTRKSSRLESGNLVVKAGRIRGIG